MKKWLTTIFGWVIVLGSMIGVGWVLYETILFLSEADKLVIVAVFGIFGIVITTISGFWLKGVENKYAVDAQFRERKVELFYGFMCEFDKLSQSKEDENSSQELADYLKEWQRKLLFWGGPKAILGFAELRDSPGESKTIDDLGRMLKAFGTLILTMREDLGLSNKGIDKETIGVRLILRHANVFLHHLETNPNMTTAEYSEIEQSLNKE